MISCQTLKILILNFILIFATHANALNTQAQYTKFESGIYNGRTWGLSLGGEVTQWFKPTLGFTDFTRDYTGTSIHETIYGAGVVSIFSPRAYLESNVTVAPNAVIAPLESVDFTPHYVVGANDFGLKMGYSHFADSKTGLLVPSVYHDFLGPFSAYGAVYIVRTGSYLTAGQAKVNYELSDHHRFSLGGAGGRTLEDATVEANFKSVSADYVYTFSRFNLGLSHTSYWSNVRWERSYTLTFGYK